MNTSGFDLETAPTIAPAPAGLEVGVAAKTSQLGKGKESVGQRLARFRRERGLTQVELAKELGVAQPIISGYERDELRLHGQVIADLTRVLRVSADELLGLEPREASVAVKNRRLLRRLQELERLPKRDQQALLRTIDAFLSKAS